MRFEHLVLINDPANPLIESLTRAQVWAGLLQRVEDARLFLPGLDVCEVVAREGNRLDRRLMFGATEVLDRVTLIDQESVCFDTLPNDQHGGGRLLIRIEERPGGHLMLRFIYDSVFALGHESEDAAYAEYLRQAYEAADIDTVRIVRQLAEAARHLH